MLNDIADKRWNGAEATFAPNDLKGLRHESKKHFYSFYDLFSRERFRKQSLMQMMSVFTYSMVAMAYFYVIREFTGSSIMIVFLDGFLRQALIIYWCSNFLMPVRNLASSSQC